MTIWRTIPVAEQPEVRLSQWRVFEMPDGSRHFNGYVAANREGRVSSAIQEFDPATGRGRTRSDRIYELTGPAGWTMDADYVLGRWLAINKVARDQISFVAVETPTDPDATI